MKSILAKNRLYYVIAFALALFMLNVPLVLKPYLTDRGPTWLGLDISWKMALNYAWINHLTHGKDIIYTYGPLGFLSTRMGWGISKWIFVCFDLFVVFNFFSVFRDFILRSANKLLSILILLGTTLLLNVSFGSSLPWILLFFIFYWLFKTYTQPKPGYFFIICVLSTLSFYLKLNTGLMGVVFLFTHLTLLLAYKRISMGKAATVLLMLAGISGVSLLLLNVSLAGYIKNAFEIIRGYNDIMYLNEEHKNSERAILILFSLASLVYVYHIILLIKRKQYSQLFYSIISLLYLVLLKKQATLRNDVQHLSEFFASFCLVFLSGNLLFTDKEHQKPFLGAMLIIVYLSLFFYHSIKPIQIAFTGRYSTVGKYFGQLAAYDKIEFLSQADKRYIPERALHRIGDKSIDVFPWDSEYLIEHKLNYTPRPVFQSFSAFTETLEKENYTFYEHTPPEFVLYDYDQIDGRYPFNDEPLVNLFLLKNYEPKDTFNSNERWRILLQKKTSIVPVKSTKVKEEHISCASEILVGGFDYVKMDISYSLRGKLHSIWKRSPEIAIMYMKPDGQWQTYKTSRELLKAGIYVEKLIMNNRDFYHAFFPTDSMMRTKKVKLRFDDTRYFAPTMKIEYSRLM